MHHVSQGTGFIIIICTSLKTQVFSNRDLNMVHIIARPNWLEQHIGKSQDHEVLYRLFAKIMVNPKNLAFGVDLSNTVIDRLGRFQIGPDRLFQHNPSVAL